MEAGDLIAVTGASRGIGAAIAIALARCGFTIGCLSRRGELPAGAEGALRDRFVAARCDVTEEESLRRALTAVLGTDRRLVGMVNNAGLYLEGPSRDFSTADFERVMATNATAVFVGCREAYPHLVASGGGTIVNIGSFFDKLGVKRNLAYCASKAAVGAITRCLAVEWAGKRIRVIDVAPGYIETDLNRAALEEGPLRAHLERRIPTGGPGTPGDVARLVAVLFRDPMPFLTGETIYIDGGQGAAF